jgi:phage-related protein
MDTLTYVPSSQTRGQIEPRVRRAQFGNGYVQEEPDGLNALMETWQLVYEPIHGTSGTTPTLSQLLSFFNAQIGTKFLWTPPAPFNTQKQYAIASAYEWVYDQGLIVGFRVTIQQRPTT